MRHGLRKGKIVLAATSLHEISTKTPTPTESDLSMPKTTRKEKFGKDETLFSLSPATNVPNFLSAPTATFRSRQNLRFGYR
jgi:CRISPR/Cas system-associated protein Cas7 (RAMP superfamily)